MVALSIDWLRDRDWRSLTALLAATLSQVHGIARSRRSVIAAAAGVWAGSPRRQLRRIRIARGTPRRGSRRGPGVPRGLRHRAPGGLVDRGGLAVRHGSSSGRLGTGDVQPAEQCRPDAPVGERAVLLAAVVDDSVLLLALLGLWRQRRDAVVRQVVPFTVLSMVGLLASRPSSCSGSGARARRTRRRGSCWASLIGPPSRRRAGVPGSRVVGVAGPPAADSGFVARPARGAVGVRGGLARESR
jgi:hypothetical protein